MTDPIGTTASALSIIGKFSTAARWLLQKLSRKPVQSPRHEPPRDFEVMPVTFMIDLTRDLPYVEVSYYAINHRSCVLTLHELKVTQLRLSGGPVIEQIPLLQEFSLPPKNTLKVFCRRNLIDSETRAIAAIAGKNSFENASFALVARAKDGRREYTYGPVDSKWIEGWINRPQA